MSVVPRWDDSPVVVVPPWDHDAVFVVPWRPFSWDHAWSWDHAMVPRFTRKRGLVVPSFTLGWGPRVVLGPWRQGTTLWSHAGDHAPPREGGPARSDGAQGTARRPGSQPIAVGEGGAAARRRRPAHGVRGGNRRRQRPHDPRAVLSDGCIVPLLLYVMRSHDRTGVFMWRRW